MEPSQVIVETSTNLSEHDIKTKKVLPPIIKKNKEFQRLPKNLLVTLTQVGTKYDDLGPGKRRRTKKCHSKTDNVWNHEVGQTKFKHLTDQPPCYCGAGRDISYLLDANKKQSSKSGDKGLAPEFTEHGQSDIPESIVPSEFHVIKHKGVLGLDVHTDKYTTTTEDHKEHLTVFPSMKPSGRQEALQLMETMNSLLEKAGVTTKTIHADNEQLTEEMDGKQIERLLEIVKEEQKIYNIIFNEVIRQVSIECSERGAVLAELRKRYANMFDRVPKEVKSLHEEVLAQRALDRRLTEEISRFKTSITILTRELHEIHAHDQEVTKQAIETQAELNEALKESEKNASLLAEYHDLYELQRRRLDYQLTKLIEERDLWAGSAHMLSLKVTEKHNLVSVRRLHLFEKTWYKIANRFTVLLGQEDDKQLHILAGHVHHWQDIAESFNERLFKFESNTCEKIKSVRKALIEWGKRFERVVTPDEGHVHPPPGGTIQDLFKVIKSWEEISSLEVERFTGDVLLSCEDDLLQLDTCVDLWNETALKIFANHPVKGDDILPQHRAMIELNKNVDELHTEFKLRMSGENGLAKNFIQLINSLNTWLNKIKTMINGGETMFDSEWVQLAGFVQVQWREIIDTIIAILSPFDPETDEFEANVPIERKDSIIFQKIDVIDVYNATQKWLNNTIDTFENENENLIEQVTATHSNLIRWMVTILIRLVPDTVDKNEPDSILDEDKSAGLGSSIVIESTSSTIIERATKNFNWLRSLTDLIISCCKNIDPSEHSDYKNENTNVNARDLKKLEYECQGWMKTANALIHEITGNTIPLDDFVKEKPNYEEAVTTPDPSTRPTTVAIVSGPNDLECTNSVDNNSDDKKQIQIQDAVGIENLPVKFDETTDTTDDQIVVDEMRFIGADENVQRKIIAGESNNLEISGLGSAVEGGKRSVVDGVTSSLSFGSLSALEQLQQQLLETEERSQNAEDRAFAAEQALREAEERIRALERSFSRMEQASASRVSEVEKTK